MIVNGTKRLQVLHSVIGLITVLWSVGIISYISYWTLVFLQADSSAYLASVAYVGISILACVVSAAFDLVCSYKMIQEVLRTSISVAKAPTAAVDRFKRKLYGFLGMLVALDILSFIEALTLYTFYLLIIAVHVLGTLFLLEMLRNGVGKVARDTEDAKMELSSTIPGESNNMYLSHAASAYDSADVNSKN